MVFAASTEAGIEQRIWDVLHAVSDPEIPVISVVDLGIVRGVSSDTEGRVRVMLTPTYSGCPATEVIRGSVLQALHEAGFRDVEVVDVLSPAWTSDWLSDEGRRKLIEYGIAPPAERVASPRAILRGTPVIHCPLCKSADTAKISEFGSTPCKALYRCSACLEPFDYFKCH